MEHTTWNEVILYFKYLKDKSTIGTDFLPSLFTSMIATLVRVNSQFVILTKHSNITKDITTHRRPTTIRNSAIPKDSFLLIISKSKLRSTKLVTDFQKKNWTEFRKLHSLK